MFHGEVRQSHHIDANSFNMCQSMFLMFTRYGLFHWKNQQKIRSGDRTWLDPSKICCQSPSHVWDVPPFFHMFSHHPTRVDLGPFAYRNWPSLTYQSMWHLGDQLQDLPGSWSPSAVLRAPGSFWSTNWHRRSSGSLVRRSSPLKMAERCGSLLGKSMNIDDSVHLNKIKQYCLDDFRILLEVLRSENQTQSCVMTIMIRKRNTS